MPQGFNYRGNLSQQYNQDIHQLNPALTQHYNKTRQPSMQSTFQPSRHPSSQSSNCPTFHPTHYFSTNYPIWTSVESFLATVESANKVNNSRVSQQGYQQFSHQCNQVTNHLVVHRIFLRYNQSESVNQQCSQLMPQPTNAPRLQLSRQPFTTIQSRYPSTQPSAHPTLQQNTSTLYAINLSTISTSVISTV